MFQTGSGPRASRRNCAWRGTCPFTPAHVFTVTFSIVFPATRLLPPFHSVSSSRAQGPTFLSLCATLLFGAGSGIIREVGDSSLTRVAFGASCLQEWRTALARQNCSDDTHSQN